MKNLDGSALLVVLIIMALLTAWAGYQWRSIAYLADIAFKKQEYYQHYYETLGVLHVAQLFIQENEDQLKKIVHARKPLIIPFVIPTIHPGQKESSLLLYVTKKDDSFHLISTYGNKSDYTCSMHCSIAQQKESDNIEQRARYTIYNWSSTIK